MAKIFFCRRIYGDNFKLVKKKLVQPFLLAPKSGDLFISSDLFDPRLRPRGIGDAFAVHLQTVSAMNMVLGDRMLMKATKMHARDLRRFPKVGGAMVGIGSWAASGTLGWQLLAP